VTQAEEAAPVQNADASDWLAVAAGTLYGEFARA